MKYDKLDEKIITTISDYPAIKFGDLFELLKDDCRALSQGPIAETFRVLDRRLQVLRRGEEIAYDKGWYLTGALLRRK